MFEQGLQISVWQQTEYPWKQNIVIEWGCRTRLVKSASHEENIGTLLSGKIQRNTTQ